MGDIFDIFTCVKLLLIALYYHLPYFHVSNDALFST